MIRVALRVAVAAALIGGGWTIGQAQAPQGPNFVLSVVTANGSTTVTCAGRCVLANLQSQNTPAAKSLSYPCANTAQRCASPTIGGWIVDEKPVETPGPTRPIPLARP